MFSINRALISDKTFRDTDFSKILRTTSFNENYKYIGLVNVVMSKWMVLFPLKHSKDLKQLALQLFYEKQTENNSNINSSKEKTRV